MSRNKLLLTITIFIGLANLTLTYLCFDVLSSNLDVMTYELTGSINMDQDTTVSFNKLES